MKNNQVQWAASAPGKLMIAGEYAVLEGSKAVVMAVDRRVYASFSPWTADHSGQAMDNSAENPKISLEVMVAQSLAEARWHIPRGTISMDVSALYQTQHPGNSKSSQKLGLGSSAARASAAAATFANVAVISESYRAEISDSELFEVAFNAHRAVSPSGSGADVAASVFGGVQQIKRSASGNTEGISERPPFREYMQWPKDIYLSVTWSGRPANTAKLVEQVHAAANANPMGYRKVIDAIADHTVDLIEAFQEGKSDRFLGTVQSHMEAQQALGQLARVPIVTEAFLRTDNLAKKYAGASKPSGAGGGDVNLHFFNTRAQQQGFESECTDKGETILDLHLEADGIKIERSRKPNKQSQGGTVEEIGYDE